MGVECINRKLGVCVMVGGHVWPISTWLDDDGDECTEPDAVMCVVGPCRDDYRREFWVTLDLSEFSPTAPQQ
jgi:hypothetical protein